MVPALQELTAWRGRWTRAGKQIHVREKSKCSREMSQGPGGRAGSPWGSKRLPGDIDARTRKTRAASPAHSVSGELGGSSKVQRLGGRREFGRRAGETGASVAGESGEERRWGDGGGRVRPGAGRTSWCPCHATASPNLALTRTDTAPLSVCDQEAGSAQLGASAPRSPRRLGCGLS